MADVIFGLLPKCLLARIDKYWYPTLPVDFPESSSTFEFVTGDDKVAMIEMEKNLGTEDSIIKAEDLPTHEAAGAYLGTYDVEGEPDTLTLLSPNALPENAVGALAYHYDAENDKWDKIEDVEVVDGYVWGKVASFSPIAVFALKRAAYYDTTKSQLPYDVYVCNGIPTKVYKNEEDKVVAESDGVVTVLETSVEEGPAIVGGSYDGTDIESTDVYCKDVTLSYVVGGSFIFGDSGIENKNHTKNVKLALNNCIVRMAFGAGIWNCVDEVEITVNDTKITSGLGNQIAYYKNHKSNATLDDSYKWLGANQWVKKSNITIKNSEVYVGYCAGCNGMSTTLEAEFYGENTKFEYFCNGQSNGSVAKSNSTLVGCEVVYLNNNNRGHWGEGKITLKGGNLIKNGFVFADPTDDDKEMADILGTVSYDINAGDTFESFCVGSISNKEVTTAEEAAKYIGTLKASRDANITYTRKADVILKDIMRIK